MRTIIRDNYEPHSNDYHDKIVHDEVNNKIYLFDCDGVFLNMSRTWIKVKNELGDSTTDTLSQAFITAMWEDLGDTLQEIYGDIAENDEKIKELQASFEETIKKISEEIGVAVEQLKTDMAEVQQNLEQETTARTEADDNLQTQIDAIVNSSDVKDVVGTYSELQSYQTSTLGKNDIIKVLKDETHNGATTYYRWDGTKFDLVGEIGPYYTKGEIGDRFLAGVGSAYATSNQYGVSLAFNEKNLSSGKTTPSYINIENVTANTSGVLSSSDYKKFNAAANQTETNTQDISEALGQIAALDADKLGVDNILEGSGVTITKEGEGRETKLTINAAGGMQAPDLNWNSSTSSATAPYDSVATWLLEPGLYSHRTDVNVYYASGWSISSAIYGFIVSSTKVNGSQVSRATYLLEGRYASDTSGLSVNYYYVPIRMYQVLHPSGQLLSPANGVSLAGATDTLTSRSPISPLSANQGRVLNEKIGDLATLTTSSKGSVVAAINELASSPSGGSDAPLHIKFNLSEYLNGDSYSSPNTLFYTFLQDKIKAATNWTTTWNSYTGAVLVEIFIDLPPQASNNDTYSVMLNFGRRYDAKREAYVAAGYVSVGTGKVQQSLSFLMPAPNNYTNGQFIYTLNTSGFYQYSLLANPYTFGGQQDSFEVAHYLSEEGVKDFKKAFTAMTAFEGASELEAELSESAGYGQMPVVLLKQRADDFEMDMDEWQGYAFDVVSDPANVMETLHNGRTVFAVISPDGYPTSFNFKDNRTYTINLKNGSQVQLMSGSYYASGGYQYNTSDVLTGINKNEGYVSEMRAGRSLTLFNYEGKWYTGTPAYSVDYKPRTIGGGSDVEVVQETGDSETAVMSQKATTNMVFGETGSIQIGKETRTSAERDVVIGRGAFSEDGQGIVIGEAAKISRSNPGSSMQGTVVIGAYGKAYDSAQTAVGYAATANKFADTSLGYGASTTGNNATALGCAAEASAIGAVALGAYSRARVKGQCDIGCTITDVGYNGSKYRLLTGLYDPQDDHDAATKAYVDNKIAELEAKIAALGGN